MTISLKAYFKRLSMRLSGNGDQYTQVNTDLLMDLINQVEYQRDRYARAGVSDRQIRRLDSMISDARMAVRRGGL